MSERNETATREDSGQSGAEAIAILKKSKTRKGPRAFVLALLVLVAGIAYALFARATVLQPQPPQGELLVDAQNTAMLKDHLWIDKIPEKDTDKFNFYFFDGQSGQDFAINDQAQSSYRHLLELFAYRATNKEVHYQFPHDRRKGKTAYKIEKLPKPDKNGVDHKLTISADPQSGNAEHVYYTGSGWQSLDRNTWPAALRSLPRLEP